MTRVRPASSQDWERKITANGFMAIAGIDEVGRGALAGPVVAGAVILPLFPSGHSEILDRIQDSKSLTPAQRIAVAPIIEQIATAFAIGEASPQEVDSIGISDATRLAMSRALTSLPSTPDHLLVDGFVLEWRNIPSTAIIHGDRVSTVIAAASIIAKVHRDTLMKEMDLRHPAYSFGSHKGYGTSSHIASLTRYGPSPIHRTTFSPLRELLAKHPET